MAFLTPVDSWDNDEVYQFETTDPVQGGPGGIDNLPTQALANSNKYLYNRLQETMRRLPAGSVTGCVLEGDVNGTTGEYNYLQGAPANLGADFIATINASGSEPFICVFQDGRDSNGASVFYVAKLQTNFTAGTAVDLGTGVYPVVAIYDTNTSAITDVIPVAELVISPVQPTFSTNPAVWINDRTATAKYWDGSVFTDIVCTPIGWIGVTKLGTYTVDYTKSLGAFELWYDPNTPAATVIENAGEFDSNVIRPFGGYLLANGSVVAIKKYPRLYAKIGDTYNTGGEGAGNFRIPNRTGTDYVYIKY